MRPGAELRPGGNARQADSYDIWGTGYMMTQYQGGAYLRPPSPLRGHDRRSRGHPGRTLMTTTSCARAEALGRA